MIKNICKLLVLFILVTYNINLYAGEYCVTRIVGSKEYTRCNGKLVKVCNTINGKTYCKIK